MKPKVGKVSSFLQFLEMGYSHIPVCFIFFILTWEQLGNWNVTLDESQVR